MERLYKDGGLISYRSLKQMGKPWLAGHEGRREGSPSRAPSKGRQQGLAWFWTGPSDNACMEVKRRAKRWRSDEEPYKLSCTSVAGPQAPESAQGYNTLASFVMRGSKDAAY